MNKEEAVNKLTWKYFWQQKIKEISLFLIVVVSIIFIPYILGHNIGDNMDIGCGTNGSGEIGECHYLVQWIEGLAYIFLGGCCIVFCLFILAMIYDLLEDWIKSNWNRAEERAKKELKVVRK